MKTINHTPPDPPPLPRAHPLRAVDLNLLVILEALLNEAHVTRAAERLALSQSATSSALDRCRALFNDPLLLRHGPRMILTPRALALRDPVKQALAGVRALLAPPSVDLSAETRTIRIGMADALMAHAAATLHQRLQNSAPGLCLVYRPWQGTGAFQQQLVQGTLDLAVSVLPTVSGALRQVELLHDHHVVAMRREHPLSHAFDLDGWLAHRHIVVSSQGDTRGTLDDVLLRSGRQRRVGAVVPNFLAAMALIEHTDLIALLPSRSLTPTMASRLCLFEPPVPIEPLLLHLAWHERSDADPTVQHVAQLLRDVLAL